MDYNRKQIHNLIKEKVNQVSSGKHDRNVIFLKGEAGIGKSTLINNLIIELNEAPELYLTCISECSTPITGIGSGEPEALLPWINILDNLAIEDKNSKHHTHQLINDLALAWVKLIPVFGTVISDTASALKNYLKVRKKKETEGSEAESQAQLFQQFINLLKKLSQNITVILVFDDFHWADPSSNNLLFTAARQLIESKILFIIVYRPEDIKLSNNDEAHYLFNIRNELIRYNLSEDIEVKGITHNELTNILQVLINNYIENKEFENWLLKISRGNALFITQFINTLKEDGIIDEKIGLIVSDYHNIEVPQSIYAVIKNRVSHLSEENQNILRYASVEGETFSLFILSQITGTQPLQLIQKLRILDDKYSMIKSFGKQAIYAQETTVYEFSNSILHKIMYDSLLEEEKEILHRQIFDIIKKDWNSILENRINFLNTTQKLVKHAEIIKEFIFGAKVLLESARTSWKTFSENETLNKIDKALSFLEKDSNKSNIDKNNIYKLKGALFFLKGRVNENRAKLELSINNYTNAGEFYKISGDIEKYIDTLNAVAWVLGIIYKPDEGIKLCKEAIEKCNEVKYLKGKAMLLNTLGGTMDPVKDSDEIIKLYKESIDIKKNLGDLRGYAITLTNIGKNYLSNCKYNESLDYFDEALQIFKNIDDSNYESVILNNRGIALEELGLIDEALESYRKSLTLREKTGNLRGQGSAYDNIGNIMKKLGKYEFALENIQKSLEMFSKAEDINWVCFELNEIGSIYRLMGDIVKSQYYLRRASEYIDKINDNYTISHIYYEQAALEKAIGMKLSEIEKIKKLNNAKTLIKKAINISPRDDSNEIKEWKEELKSLDEMLPGNP